MSPWLVLFAAVAAVNLAGLLVIRGKWGRIVLVLVPAALVGTAAGEAVGRLTGLELVTIGDFHLVAASIGAQLAMVAVLLLASALPDGSARDAGGR